MQTVMPTLDHLLLELRSNASDDTAFAQRVALACAQIADHVLAKGVRADPGEAIRCAFNVPLTAGRR